MKYITNVQGKEFVIEIDEESRIRVNDEAYDIDFQQLTDDGVISLLIENRSLEAVVEERDELWQVLMKGQLYSVKVQDERAYRLAMARGAGGAGSGDETIKSPMPGLIVDVPVAEGDVVTKGDKVVILESMKMENELKASGDGVIGRILVGKGDSVEKGQDLVVILPPDEEEE